MNGEWLLFNPKWAIFQKHVDHASRSYIPWNDNDVRLVLDEPAKLDIYSILVVHWNNSPWVVMSLKQDTLSRYWAKQSFLIVHSSECLPEKHQIAICTVFGLTLQIEDISQFIAYFDWYFQIFHIRRGNRYQHTRTYIELPLS